MQHQFEHKTQQPQTPEEIRQSLLTELEVTKQAIEEISDEQLEDISGGGIASFLSKAKTVYEERFQLHPENIIPGIKNKIETARDQARSYRAVIINGR